MAGNIPAVCSACEGELGDPAEEIAHPDDDNPPEDPHFRVQIRDDGEERKQCIENGQMAKVLTPNDPDHPANSSPPEGEGEVGPQPEDPGRTEPSTGGVYDFPEEKEQIDVLEDVVTNPHYGLEEPQIREIREWAEDFDGQIPPDTLEEILSKFEGVQKQTAGLIRKRYELKLNKWMREQSQEEQGPPIGIGARPTPSQMGSPSPPPRPKPTPSDNKQPPKQSGPDETSEEPGSGSTGDDPSDAGSLRDFRRYNRAKRRDKAIDTAMETAAQEAADEIARELASNFGGLLSLPQTILQRKAEKDPDWFLEKAEQLDIDIMDLMEPSEQRKKEMESGGSRDQTQVDGEVDSVLDDIEADEPQTSDNGSERPNTPTYEERDANPMSAGPDDHPVMEETQTEDTEEEDSFDEIFGDDDEEEDTRVPDREQMMQQPQEEQ